MLGFDRYYAAGYWHTRDDESLQCDLCPRDCLLDEGERGACFVRARLDNRMVLTTYGRSTGFRIDPIERKPLNHFYPGSRVFSFATAGCNLACTFCRSMDIVRSHDMDGLLDPALPGAIARTARQYGCQSVAFTYNDPVVFLEYALDTADACHDRGLKTVAVTAGYIRDAPRRALFARMDAVNVDLKAFSERFYSTFCCGHLQPVLDTLRYIRHQTASWLEITMRLIPGYNDTDDEIAALAGWVANELGSDVPLHFTAFQQDREMADLPQRPSASLTRARRIAREAGLRYVYVGQGDDPDGEITGCPGCGLAVIVRDGYDVLACNLRPPGSCPHCGTAIAGSFGHLGRVPGPPRRAIHPVLRP